MTYRGRRVPGWAVAVAMAALVTLFMILVVLPVASLLGEASRQDLSAPYVALLIWRDAHAWLARLDWMVIFGAVLIVGTIVVLWKLSTGEGPFSLSDAFAGENGKTSMAKLTAWIGSLTASWIMVALTIQGKMTETYVFTYLGVLVLGKVGTELVGVARQSQIARTLEATGGSPPPPTEPVPSAGRVAVTVEAPVRAAEAAVDLDTLPARRPSGKRARNA